MEIKIDEKQLQAVVSEAILAQLGESERTNIISQAIVYLTTQRDPKNGYSYTKQPSPIQEAFNIALDAAAREIAHDYVRENAEFRAAIRGVLNDAAAEALTKVEAIRTALVKAAIAALYEAS